jgi:hypothetical protein
MVQVPENWTPLSMTTSGDCSVPLTLAGTYSSMDSAARTFALTVPPPIITTATSIYPKTKAPAPMTKKSLLRISPRK